MELRQYQIDIIAAMRESMRRGNKRIVLCAPTGSGKTVMFTFMVKQAIDKGGRVLIFTHRKELLNQSSKTFNNFGLTPELITANSKPDLTCSLHVSMVETFNRRIDDYEFFLQTRTLIIIDEAHLQPFTKLFEHFNKNTYVIGCTATPYRKGKQKSLSEFYTDIVQKIDTPELIKQGHLVDCISYGIEIETKKMKRVGDDFDTSKYYSDNKIYEGVVSNYLRLTNQKKAILFSSNISSSKEVTNQFIINGVNARHIDGETPTKEREQILEWFANTPNAVLCNCGILTAGFDQPDIEVVILYRATTSLPLFLQMCGRGSRTHENKSKFIILDFGNNIGRLGYWEDARVWSLHKEEKKKADGAQLMKSCKNCEALIPANAKVCKFCNFQYPQKEKEKNEYAELTLLNKKHLGHLALNKSVEEKVEMCKNKLVNPAWLLHNMTDKKEAMLFIKLMGYKPGWLYFNKDRYAVFRR
jgi:superfamily II DNA or RNA helicase